MSDKQQLKAILQPYMNAADVTMTQLAKVIGVSLVTLSKKFKHPGTFKLYELKAICDYLNVSKEDRGALLCI